MNKKLTLVLLVVAIALIAYNITLVNFDAMLEGDSVIALIGIMASLCAIVLILIYNASKKIQDNVNKD